MNKYLDELEKTESAEVAVKLASKAGDVMLLGGDTADAMKALDKWKASTPAAE